MSFKEKRNIKSSEYRLLVDHSVIQKLYRILQDYEKLKLDELCSKYESEYKQKLVFFITKQNELVIELESSNQGSSDEASSLETRLPKGWNRLEECMKKIDFSSVLHRNVRKISDREVSADEIKNYESVHFYCEFSKVNDKKEEEQNLKLFEKCLGKSEIPIFFDKVSWKPNNTYEGFVTAIYDLSKFWMRFADIHLLEKFLWEFYDEKKDEYTLSLPDVSIGLNCAVLMSDGYHRGRIIKTDIQNPEKFVIFLYDSGITCRFTLKSLFKLHEKFSAIPALAVRCSLSNISPIDNESWTEAAVTQFETVTKHKRLSVKVSHVKTKRKILEVYMSDPATKIDDNIPTFNYLFVLENLAKISWEEPVKSTENLEFKRLSEYTYLYPTHEMIECGVAPSSLYLTNKLKKCVAWDVLFPDFYEYRK